MFSTYKRPQPWQAALESDLVPTMPRTRTWTSPYRSTPRPHSSSRSTRPRRPLFRYEGRQNPGAATVQPGHRYSENTPAMQRNKMAGNWLCVKRAGEGHVGCPRRGGALEWLIRVERKMTKGNGQRRLRWLDLPHESAKRGTQKGILPLSLSFGEKWRLFDPLLHHF